MMKLKKGPGPLGSHSLYISRDLLEVKERNKEKHKSPIKVLLSLFMLFMTVFTVGSQALVSTVVATQVAYAEDEEKDDTEDKLKEAAGNYAGSSEEMIEKYNKGEGLDDENSFGYVLRRILGIYYINETPLASAPIGEEFRQAYCDPNDPMAGTPLYHNCDVPNITTQFLQDLLDFMSFTGMQQASSEIATLESPWFGLPSGIPNEGLVPNDPDQRTVKFTGLELFGYNLKFTEYRGEFDKIKVKNSARMLSNYGFFDGLKLGINSMKNGASAAFSNYADNLTTAISEGSIWGIVSAPWTAPEAGVSGLMRTILDTQDANVMESWAWYRPDYGGRLYGARELTQEEKAELQVISLRQIIAELLGQDEPEEKQLPEDFKALKEGPKRPSQSIASCIATMPDGTKKSLGSTVAPGPSESECSNLADQAGAVDFEWSETGKSEKETDLAAWKESEKAWFEGAQKYGIECEIDVEATDIEAELSKFYQCVPTAWEAASTKVMEEHNSGSLIGGPISMFLMKKVAKVNNPELPWLIYVCEGPDGTVKDANGNFRFVYNRDGSLTGNCSPARPPIQDGLFGSGYTDSQPPGVDTRREVLGDNPLAVIIPQVSDLSTWIGTAGLSFASFFTRIGNTFINLAYSPILENFNLDEIVLKTIEEFRQSVYFPLVVIIMAAGAVYVTFLFIKGGGVGAGSLRSFLTMAVALVFGVIFLLYPAAMIKLADEIPSAIENSLINAIQGKSSDMGEICEVSNPAGTSDAQNTARVMTCQYWAASLFAPWVAGQWGAPYGDLYSAGTVVNDGDKTLTNTNEALVGNAAVNMGGGTIVRNWALYNLDAITSGTSTDRDYLAKSGKVNTDLYRIVDLQAGPNNGAGTDSTYFANWSGENVGTRIAVGFMAPITAFFLMLTAVLFSFQKILLTFFFTLMLLASPFVLAIGVFPKYTRVLKSYVLALLGVLIQKVVFMLLLSLVLIVTLNITNNTRDYFIGAVAASVISLIFLKLRKPMLSKVGMSQAGAFNPRNFRQTADKVLPVGVRNNYTSATSAFKAIPAAVAGGIASGGGMSRVVSEVKTASRLSQHRRQLQNRRKRGLSKLQSIDSARRKVEVMTVKDLKNREDFSEVARDLSQLENAKLENRPETKQLFKDVGLLADGQELKTDITKSGTNLDNSTQDMSPRKARRLAKLYEAKEKQEALGESIENYKDPQTGYASQRKLDKILTTSDLDSIDKQQTRKMNDASLAVKKAKAERAENIYQNLLNATAERELRQLKRQSINQQMKDDLARMFAKEPDIQKRNRQIHSQKDVDNTQ